MTEIIDVLYYFAVMIAAMSLLITLSNLRFIDSLEFSLNKSNNRNRNHLVSILVPARNEEDNIAQCLHALIAQNYDPLEIIVLDDRSTDRTLEIVQDIASTDARVTAFSGTELPKGWIGKNWACHQLAQKATGEFLLFTDADTILSNVAIPSAVLNSINNSVDLLTVMPRRITRCVVEKLLFPFIDWASFCWMPMKRAHNSQNSHLSAAFGQFMFFKREAYQEIGGHDAIRSIPIDDFALGRSIKKHGLRWTLLEGANCVRVLPSNGNVDAFRDVSRSIFPAIYHRFSLFAFLAVTLLALGFLPLLAFTTSVIAYPHESQALVISATSMCMTAIPWFIVCLKFNHGTFTGLLYPLSIFLMVMAAFHSVITYSFGHASWKKRKLVGLRR